LIEFPFLENTTVSRTTLPAKYYLLTKPTPDTCEWRSALDASLQMTMSGDTLTVVWGNYHAVYTTSSFVCNGATYTLTNNWVDTYGFQSPDTHTAWPSTISVVGWSCDPSTVPVLECGQTSFISVYAMGYGGILEIIWQVMGTPGCTGDCSVVFPTFNPAQVNLITSTNCA
jgi:hypothetical protein